MADRPDRVAPHLHMPMQSGSDAVLARMNRWYDRATYLAACDRIRQRLDRPAFTADVLVGFPGEGEQEFAETLAAVSEAGFARLHVFPFSPRPGTEAESMHDRPDPMAVRERRAALSEAADAVAAAYGESLVGARDTVVLEGFVGLSGAISAFGWLRARWRDCPARSRWSSRAGGGARLRRARPAPSRLTATPRTSRRSRPRAPMIRDMGHADPQAERAALARALARELQRRTFHGERRRAARPGGGAAASGRRSRRRTARRAQQPRLGRDLSRDQPAGEWTRRVVTPTASPARCARGASLTPADVDDRRAAVAARAAAASTLDELRAEVADLHGLWALRLTHPDRVHGRHRLARGRLRGRGPGRAGGSDRGPLRGARRPAPHRHRHQGNGPAPRRGGDRQRPQVPSPWEPGPEARGEGHLHPVAGAAAGAPGARVLIPLGKHASGHLLGTPDASMGSMRGRTHQRPDGTQVVPTYHPAYLLRNPGDKRLCWADIQVAMDAAGIPRPGR